MADLGKRVSRPPKRFMNENSEHNEEKPTTRSEKPKADRKLYEIEVKEVDRERKRLKIHFVGYSDKFDEWRDFDVEEYYFPFIRHEKNYVPGNVSLKDRSNIFHSHLYRAVKRKLWSGRRDDPEIRIEINVDEDVFSTGLGQLINSSAQRGKEVYNVKNNRILDETLGEKWDERIINSNGDFAYVETNTVRYWLAKKRSIEEYKYIGEKFVKSEIEDSNFIVFTFVRGDGNKRQYEERKFK